MELILSPRLSAIGELVRPGAVLSDVGTDHALLPAKLLLCGKIKRAIASDIVKGPLARAKETVEKYHLSDKVTTLLTPGLCGIEDHHPTDIVIAGMGGETIAEILWDAPFIKEERPHLILQPMTKGELLRDYLFAEGFEILKEKRVKEGQRIYTVLSCVYCGTPYHPTNLERLFGRVEAKDRDELYVELLEKKRAQLTAVIAARTKGGLAATEEEQLLLAIEEQLKH